MKKRRVLMALAASCHSQLFSTFVFVLRHKHTTPLLTMSDQQPVDVADLDVAQVRSGGMWDIAHLPIY